MWKVVQIGSKCTQKHYNSPLPSVIQFASLIHIVLICELPYKTSNAGTEKIILVLVVKSKSPNNMALRVYCNGDHSFHYNWYIWIKLYIYNSHFFSSTKQQFLLHFLIIKEQIGFFTLRDSEQPPNISHMYWSILKQTHQPMLTKTNRTN